MHKRISSTAKSNQWWRFDKTSIDCKVYEYRMVERFSYRILSLQVNTLKAKGIFFFMSLNSSYNKVVGWIFGMKKFLNSY